jgi:predicted acetyltransferase
MDRVVVRLALPADRTALADMLASHLAELGAAADYPWLDRYWTDANRWPYVACRDEEAVGFALVRVVNDGQLELAELYVEPAHRRRGVGGVIARELFARHVGAWRVRVLAHNARGLAFWQSMLPSARVGEVLEDGDRFIELTFANA